jgi:serine protease Do
MLNFTPGAKKAGVVAVLVGALAMNAFVARSQTAPGQAGANLSQAPTTAATSGFPVDLADVVEKVSPAVVNIQVTLKGRASARAEGGQQFNDQDLPPGLRDFFRRYFGEPNGNGNNAPQQRRRAEPRGNQGSQGPKTMALGSGFIIDASGLVVTNNHVVKDADSIQVTTKDGDKLDATLVGRDDRTDLALLKVKSDKPLAFVSFGDSDSMRVGNWVFTVGNPFGLGHTVTTGIISARGRSIGAGPYDDFLQIDAPINQGNSGGPAFNLKGDVIGINTAIFSPSGGSVGIGFAIPSSMAKDVIEQLKGGGTVTRGWIGVEIQNVNKDIADSLGLKSANGALVAKVMDDGPAKSAGVKQGDVITGVNGKDVHDANTLPRIIASIKPGEKADLKMVRDGKEAHASITVGNLAEHQTEMDVGQNDDTNGSTVAGMELAAVNDETRQALGLGKNVKGVVVTDVDDNSEAAARGIASGDVILKVGNEAVSTPADVAKKIADAKSKNQKTVLMLVIREAHERFVALPVGNA